VITIDISWLGHSCFTVKGKGVTLLTDPYDESIGYSLGSPKANIVTSSHPHPGHGSIKAVSGEPKAVHGPGEYEVSGVFITGTPTFHDAEGGRERGKNTVFLIEMEDVRLCHLGDLGHPLSTGQVEEIGEVDVLMVPVGGVSTIDAGVAAEVVRLLQPGIVVPMHYHTDVLRFQLDPLDRFLKEMGIKAGLSAQPKLALTKVTLPEETQVVVLDYKAS
jgi:L-ascorbate metabolism protein UlaG (beta-lactamase superfamily)